MVFVAALFLLVPLLGSIRSVCSFSMSAGRVAVVTGANKGIGLEIARALGKVPGHICILGCRNATLGQRSAEELKREGCNVVFRQIDISDQQSIQAFSQQLKQEFGGLDILVNNAAIAFKARDPTPFRDQARPTIDVNFYGTVKVCEALVPLLRDGGRISMVASMAGRLSNFPPAMRSRVLAPDLRKEELMQMTESFVEHVQKGDHSAQGWPNSCYGVSKAAVNAYTRILARELAGRRILVNSCCPGYCATDMSSWGGTKTAGQGAETPIKLALLPDGSPTGEYWTEGHVVDWTRT